MSDNVVPFSPRETDPNDLLGRVRKVEQTVRRQEAAIALLHRRVDQLEAEVDRLNREVDVMQGRTKWAMMLWQAIGLSGALFFAAYSFNLIPH